MSSVMIEHADGLPQPQRNWAILTIALGLVMAVMDGAIANVALPTIARDLMRKPGVFDLDRQRLSAGDHDFAAAAGVARRNHRLSTRLSGGAYCCSRSLRCFARCRTRCLLLTVARIMQGFGAAGIMSVNAALVRYTYPRALLGRGIGLNALVVAISAALGPTVASVILAVGTWPYLFAINIPLGS